jgi:hypothetical protein
MEGLHPVEQLWKRLDEIIQSWPKGSVPVPPKQRIDGLGCFPCGYGLWEKRLGQPPPPMPARAVMLIGNNWGNTEALCRDYRRGENPKGVYWGTLRPLLEEAGLAMKDCFATNAYPGLLAGDSNVGEFPGADDEQFQAACREFMVEQIRVVRPALIVTVGLYVPPFLAPLSPHLDRWRDARTLKDLNGNNALVHPAAFGGQATPRQWWHSRTLRGASATWGIASTAVSQVMTRSEECWRTP